MITTAALGKDIGTIVSAFVKDGNEFALVEILKRCQELARADEQAASAGLTDDEKLIARLGNVSLSAFSRRKKAGRTHVPR